MFLSDPGSFVGGKTENESPCSRGSVSTWGRKLELVMV